jgi:hypothetical protein
VSAPAVREGPHRRPADFCRALLAAADASEGRRRRRKRDTTPDALGLAIKRAMLERLVIDDPDAGDLDAWLFAQCTSVAPPCGDGAVQAMALEILHEWRLCRTVEAFGAWLSEGAPSEDRA